MTPHVKPRGRGTGGERPWWRGHLLLSFCGWFKNILVKIQPHQALSRLSPRQLEADHLADAVVDGPVQLLGLVGGQDQHEPAASTRRGLRARGQQNPPCGALPRETPLRRRRPLPPIPPSCPSSCLSPTGGPAMEASLCAGGTGTQAPRSETDPCPSHTKCWGLEAWGSAKQTCQLSRNSTRPWGSQWG